MTTNPETPTIPAGSAPRWMRLTLALSLTVNLIVVALIAGAFVRGPGGRPDRLGAEGFGAYAQAMDRADRRALFQQMHKGAGDGASKDARDRRKAQLAAVVQALDAEPFRLEDLKTAMEAQEAGMHAQIARAHDALLGYFGKMSQAERQAFADRLRHRGPPQPPAP